MKALKGITLASVCISVLYIALAAVLSFSEVSFRAWANTLGQVIAALVTPLLIISLLLALLWKNEHLTELPKTVITLLTILFCMGAAFFVSLLIALCREDETMLTKDLILIQQPYPVNDSHFVYYRPTGLFFRKAAQITDADRAEYLCEKYHLEFIFDEETGRIYTPAHPEITVTVVLLGTSFTDDYMEELTCRYLKDGYGALGLSSQQSQASAHASDTSEETADSAEKADTFEPQPDYREKSAQMIYNAFLAEEGFSYEVCYNAKGNLYIDLGRMEEDDQIYNYRLVYDRPSKNGLCELFVLYRSEEGSSDEAIIDMYAAEPDTGEVVRSGRKAWSDVGTKAYRDLTGE